MNLFTETFIYDENIYLYYLFFILRSPKNLGVTSINCSIYKVDIYNPKPTIEYPKGWYSYVGMTTEDDWHDRIKKHKTEAKPNNPKFEIIRERSNKPWKTKLIKQWQKPFNNSNEGLAFMAKYEQYYIEEYRTYGTIFGLNNSIGGDYGEGKPNTSGIEGVGWTKDKRKESKGFWRFYNHYNKDLRLLLYQLQDQFNIKLNILNKKRMKESLRISDKHKYDNAYTRYKYYCGSPHITITQRSDRYMWAIDHRQTSGAQYGRVNSFNLIKDFGYEIYTPILFAYQAIGLENKWLINRYTVDENKFMPFREFEKKYTIKDNKKLKKVILDNII